MMRVLTACSLALFLGACSTTSSRSGGAEPLEVESGRVESDAAERDADTRISASAPLSYKPSRWTYLSERYDANEDGAIDAEEYERGADAFARLDQDADGRVTARDFERERGSATEFIAERLVRNYFHSDEDTENLEEGEMEDTLSFFDDNGDGLLDREEFSIVMEEQEAEALDTVTRGMLGDRTVFDFLVAVMDGDGDGCLSQVELVEYYRARFPDRREPLETLSLSELAMRNRRESSRSTGTMTSGPTVGTVAPDFTLQPPEGGDAVTLSSFAGKKPVALIFGSYT